MNAENRLLPAKAGWSARTAWILAACAAAILAADAAAQAPRRKSPGVQRSRAPAGTWDDATAGTFQSDAFATLAGPRPTFSAGPAGGAPGRPAAAAAGAQPGAGAQPAAGGFAWSALVSEDSLTDEIKDARAALVTACGKPTEFKGGGFEKARVAFSSLALAFGVIAAYDRDVRWKKDAATARDLFARAGFNCKVGTDQSFAESKARLEDLELLLAGNAPKGKPDRDEDFLWSQVAGRPSLMKRLEEAQNAMRPAVASKADFKAKASDFLRAVEVVAAVGEVIRQPDFEFHDDDTYRGHAAEMRDAAAEARAAAEKNDYEAGRSAAGRIEKACTDCHGGYRS